MGEKEVIITSQKEREHEMAAEMLSALQHLHLARNLHIDRQAHAVRSAARKLLKRIKYRDVFLIVQDIGNSRFALDKLERLQAAAEEAAGGTFRWE